MTPFALHSGRTTEVTLIEAYLKKTRQKKQTNASSQSCSPKKVHQGFIFPRFHLDGLELRNLEVELRNLEVEQMTTSTAEHMHKQPFVIDWITLMWTLYILKRWRYSFPRPLTCYLLVTELQKLVINFLKYLYLCLYTIHDHSSS
ncbi:hypothetical protein ACSBR1_025493 [Camellia fascicularis]